ncbi:sensor histidine kinase [Algirhabdus cladophorae]|uniref:sensor histidine kinase n=1 Tax=Algirhabdus cladophorae TaxID=3377108 RepID=UPI003B847F31
MSATEKNEKPQEDDGPIVANATAAPSKDFEDFIYLISHDVRNSVRALLELPHWIEEDLVDAGYQVTGPLAENIQLMNTHTKRLDRMLYDLLIYSRLGRMQSIKRNDLNEALDTVLTNLEIPEGFSVLRRLEAKSVTMGNRDVLTLLGALISNSIKHHHKDSGEVVVTTRDEPREFVLTVSDDGPGIDAEFRDRVFGAMTTLKPRDEVEGSGMGLANCRKIASLYEGRICVFDTGDMQGTTVEVRLPNSSIALP